jgi:hypothetical protein
MYIGYKARKHAGRYAPGLRSCIQHGRGTNHCRYAASATDVQSSRVMRSQNVRRAANVAHVKPAWQTTTSMTDSQHNGRLAVIVQNSHRGRCATSMTDVHTMWQRCSIRGRRATSMTDVQSMWQTCSMRGRRATSMKDVQSMWQTCNMRGRRATSMTDVQSMWQTCNMRGRRVISMADRQPARQTCNQNCRCFNSVADM